MALNSVNTNVGAQVALQSLNRTNDALAVTQKRISTGFRVADAKDDGAAFAVAQSVRADIAGLASANEQMGGVKGVLDTTLAGLGWRVLRFSWEDVVHEPERVVAEVRAALALAEDALR